MSWISRMFATLALACVSCSAAGLDLLDLLSYSGQVQASDQAHAARISSVAEWGLKAASIRARVMEALGHGSGGVAPLAPRIVAEEKLEGYTRRKIAYAAATGEEIPAYLLIPAKLATPAPAVLALHQTYAGGKREAVGMEGSPNLHYALDLVRRGYVVLAPDSMTAGERAVGGRTFSTAEFDRANPAWSAMGKMLADNQRAVDYLRSLDFVDPARIAVIGHSLGAYNAFFLAAFDSRVGAAIVSCGLGPLAGSPKPFAWARHSGFVHFPRLHTYLEAGIVPFDFHEVMALAAPKPLFNYSARQDAIFPNAQMIAAAGQQVASVYGLYGATDRYRFVMSDGPHDFPPAVREQAYTFLDQWAKNAPSR